jgi:hypothetical protein
MAEDLLRRTAWQMLCLDRMKDVPPLMDCSKLTAISPMMVRSDTVETTAATFTLSSSILWTFLSRSWLLWVCSPVILRSFTVMSEEMTVTGQENRFLHMQIQ